MRQDKLTSRQLAKFVSYTDRDSSGCWLWNRSVKNGYGQYLQRYAHRWIWEFLHGPIPNGLFILHSCDNKICCNPDHLRLGTQADNMHDAAIRGRTAAKERAGNSKLTGAQVDLIRRLRVEGMTQVQLARMFQVSQGTVWQVVNEVTWKLDNPKGES